MTKKIIEVQNLSKKYLIHHKSQRYDSLKEAIANFFKNYSDQNDSEEFWALDNISVAIEEGDKVGIIGRNGAGKSTLLKILSRITEPTSGKITIRGRIASLLEVGTGFHPELSGRDNIYLNGALLGMSSQEINQKFDEIVAFSEVEQFLDTPVKRYSSGMYTRLGFAIAAHLNTDLLIVDEVLAVGDAAFQQKCLKKMNEMGKNGRTILFVSHNISAVVALCNKAIFLEKGKLKYMGYTQDCISQYVTNCPSSSFEWKGDIGDEIIRMKAASIISTTNKEYFNQGDEAKLQIDYEILKPHKDLVIGFGIWNTRNQLVARSRLIDVEDGRSALKSTGNQRACCHIDSNLFHEGEYTIRIDCRIEHNKQIVSDEISLKFPIYAKTGQEVYHQGEREGISLGNRWTLISRQ